MELFTSLVLASAAIAFGAALIVFAFKGRGSQDQRPARFRGRL